MEDASFTQLETARLVIRRFREVDAALLTAYRNDPAVARYQGWETPYTERQAAEFIASLRDLPPGRTNTWFQFAVESGESGFLIGDVALRTTPEDPGQGELGFSFAVAHQGRGYAAEAARAVIDYAFTRLRMRRIVAVTALRNVQAQRLLERIGFGLRKKIGEEALVYEQLASQSEPPRAS